MERRKQELTIKVNLISSFLNPINQILDIVWKIGYTEVKNAANKIVKIDLWISICMKEKLRTIFDLHIFLYSIFRSNYLWVLIILVFPIVSIV